MYVTDNNRTITCGPFEVTSAATRITTPAYPTSGSAGRSFQVFALMFSPSERTDAHCTSWW
ncbi:hypothetical protein [Streptomyces sp. NPDC006335]|uniref:hypothetical protein n=1 Tax=Streptomyces sp. NPDC006335 TaxID=3156895 RepID=UPI0033A408F4